MPLLHKIPAACAEIGLGRSKVYELIAAGEIEVVKVGRATLVPDSSLRAFADRLVADQLGRGGDDHAA